MSKKNERSGGAEVCAQEASTVSGLFIVLLQPSVRLTACLCVLSIVDSGASDSLTIIVELSVSCFNPVSFCFTHFGGSVRCLTIDNCSAPDGAVFSSL